MEFLETQLAGAYLIRIKRIEDERGFFARVWCGDEFRRVGLNPSLAQVNVGFSRRLGTVRGMHFQVSPFREAKLVRCTQGAIYDVIVDLREDSPTRGRWLGYELSADNRMMLYAPEGFAHGYQTLCDNSEMYYHASVPYAPASARGIRFNDPAIGIKWPLPPSIVSDADARWPDFSAAIKQA